MAKVQNKIWRCPLCKAGLRAPSRVRKNDARRYCLDCTAETGKLVERVCVARETKKQKVSERTKQALEKAKQAVAEELKLYPWCLYTWFNNWCGLDAWDDRTKFDSVVILITRNKSQSGWSYNGVSDKIYFSAGRDPAEAVAMMLWGMAGHSSKAGDEHLASFARAIKEITGGPIPVYSKMIDEAVKLIRTSFVFPEASTRMTLPEPKRRKRRKKKAEPKTKIKKAIAKREKNAEW